MQAKRLSFADACAQYRARFTMENVPAWSQRRPVDDGGTVVQYYAPQFRSDREWYDNTVFPGDPGYPFPHRGRYSRYGCYTTGQTWPLGLWLDQPYRKE